MPSEPPTPTIVQNADWLPRDAAGRFRSGFRPCLECDGTGEETVLVGDPDAPDDAEGYDTLKAVEQECRRCAGRGAEHEEGCPRCGSELHDHGVLPSSCREIGCHDCGWSEVVG